MTTPVYKLTKGARYIDLQSGRYRVYQGWAPPPVSVLPLLAEGTSANRNGATLVDRRAMTRETQLRLNVLGSSDAEIRRGIADLQTFLGMAGDESEPLYLEFRPNSDTPEPLWGNYGVNLRYEIVHGSVEIEKSYSTGARLANDVDVVISLTIKPYAVGKAQRLSSGTGRVLEVTTGATDGASKGLHILPAVTNKMTNPVFGNVATGWNAGWTASPNLTASQNTDSRFLMPGQTSGARLVSAATGQQFYQSINVGNTNTHYFVAIIALPDGGTPSSSDVEIYYNTTLTSTFYNLGSGLWRVTASAAGINASTSTGVQVKNGRQVFLCYMGASEDYRAVEPLWGDNLGCSWSGTVHASTSASVAGRVRVPVAADTFDYQQGSVRIVWTPPVAYNTYLSSNYYLFDARPTTTGLALYFDGTNDNFVLVDGTNTVTVATTFAANTPIVFHVTWGPAGLVLYVNGSATSGTYTLPTAASYVYIGSNNSPGSYVTGIFGDFAVFGEPLTAAEVLADYTNIAQLTSDGQRVSTVPWLWTKDGDDVVDNADDSSRDNWCVVGGVPGSEAADTLLVLGNSAGWLDTGAYNDLVLSLVDTPYEMFLRPASWIYFDLSGTVDANSSGGEYLSTSVTTSEATEIASQDFVTDFFRRMSGREVFVYMRIYDEGTGLPSMYVRLYPSSSLNDYYATTGLQQVSTTQNNWRLLKFGSFVIPDFRDRHLSTTSFSVPHWEMRALRASGTNNLRFDYVAFVPRPALVFSSDGGNPQAIIRGGTGNEAANWSATANGDVRLPARMFGDAIELRPNLANMLVSFIGSSTANPAIATTLTYHRVIVTPRYALL